MNKSKTIYYLFYLLLIFIFLFIFSVIFSILNIYNDNIINGISISGIDVSGMSKEEAKSIISSFIDQKIANNLEITCISSETNDVEYSNTIQISSLDIKYDLAETIESAYNIGRSGNIFQNNYTILKTLLKKRNIDLQAYLDDDKLQSTIQSINSDLPNRFIENSYYIDDNHLILVRGSDGYLIDEENFKNSIYKLLNDLPLVDNTLNISLDKLSPTDLNLEEIHKQIYSEPKNAYYETDPFKIYPEINGMDFDLNLANDLLNDEKNEYIIPLIITKPDITIDDLDIDTFPDLIASFSTKYDVMNKDRSTNLSLATDKINGTIVSPGDQFSYNLTVGKRTISSGYKNAKIYSNGEVVDGIGGGICQVSSTLYNAVMFANLEVTERHNHQFITSYVQAGRDATVVYGSKDLKFINNRSYPIKIIASANDGIVKISIYGIREDTEYDVNFDVENISTIPYKTTYEYDSTLVSNSEYIKQLGANGAIVKSYKVIKLNGFVVSKTLISQDTYNALSRIIVTSLPETISN